MTTQQLGLVMARILDSTKMVLVKFYVLSLPYSIAIVENENVLVVDQCFVFLLFRFFHLLGARVGGSGTLGSSLLWIIP